MIDHSLFNVDDLEIARPVRKGPGGDQSADPTVNYENLEAYHEPAHGVVRRVDGSDHTLTGLLMIDPLDDNLDPIDVVPGDFVRFTDFRGKQIAYRELVRVEPFYDGAYLDHLELTF